MPWLCALMWIALAGPRTPLDGPALARRIDAIVTEHLATTGVPGVVVTVTEGDRIVLERGWGVADVQSGRAMDPQTTLVRIASLSKTFTATAVAQLEDAGRLDLDADVDQYLQRLTTAGPWDSPVTLRHLLAHTSGFINYNSGRVSEHPFAPEDFERFMARTMPPRMHPPGTATLYTNHGNALAGLVVQDVTGVAFTDHVRDAILVPLHMMHTTYDVDPQQPELARSYAVADDGTRTPWPYEYFGTVPASAVHTTAHDMASYLMLHAGDGRVHGQTVLGPAAMQRMRTPAPTIHPALGQYHYAFAPTMVRGHPGRAHSGSVPAFLSKMVVFDSVGVGVFVAQNAFGNDVAGRVVEAVADALPSVPPPVAPRPVGDGKPVDADALVGRYRVLDKHETAAFTRARAVLSQPPLVISVDHEGFILVGDRRFIRIGAGVFAAQDADGHTETLVFVPGTDGNPTWVHHGRTSAFLPPWHGRREVQIAAHLLALILVLVGWFGLSRARRGPQRVWAAVAAATLVGVLGPQLYALAMDAGQPVYTHPLRLGIPSFIVALTWLPHVAATLSIAALCSRRLRHGPGLSIAAGSVLFVALAYAWQTPPPGLPPA